MRKLLMLLFALLLVLGGPIRVKAATAQTNQPEVKAVLFYTNGCPYCTEVLTNTLPPIQDKFQSQLSILLVEVSTLNEINNLYSLGNSLGLTKEQVAVPFLLIDHHALVGVDEIKQKFTSLVDQYLSSGGLEYADIPMLKDMLAKGTSFSAYHPDELPAPQTTTSTKSTGMSLAWAVMIFMILAIILAAVFILRGFQGKPLGEPTRWLEIAIPVLSVIGLGVSIYLTYVEISHANALCGPVGDCNAVQSSSYAKLFGVIPIGLVGAIGYVAILAAWLWRRFRADSVAKVAGPIMFAMALFGTLFSIYLTYLELYVIHAVCIWCLSSAVIISVLMLLSLPYLTHWLAIPEDDEEEPVVE